MNVDYKSVAKRGKWTSFAFFILYLLSSGVLILNRQPVSWQKTLIISIIWIFGIIFTEWKGRCFYSKSAYTILNIVILVVFLILLEPTTFHNPMEYVVRILGSISILTIWKSAAYIHVKQPYD